MIRSVLLTIVLFFSLCANSVSAAEQSLPAKATFDATRKAAEQGDADAQHNLGAMYGTGQGAPQDYAQAVKWYRKTAEQGLADAQFNLGLMYDRGNGVPRDYAEAMNWYRKAAEQGLAGAQHNLGVMYDQGRGVPQDYAEAMKWFRKAAEQGDADAQYILGTMYANANGVPQDYAEAMKWERKAAEQGNALAQYNLGILYRDGLGLPHDLTEATKWFRKAAEPRAQSNLHLMYEQGQGRPQDYEEACTAQGHNTASQNRDFVATPVVKATIVGLTTLLVVLISTQIPFLIARREEAGKGRRLLAYLSGLVWSLASEIVLIAVVELMGVAPQEAQAQLGLAEGLAFLGPFYGLYLAKKYRQKQANGAREIDPIVGPFGDGLSDPLAHRAAVDQAIGRLTETRSGNDD